MSKRALIPAAVIGVVVLLAGGSALAALLTAGVVAGLIAWIGSMGASAGLGAPSSGPGPSDQPAPPAVRMGIEYHPDMPADSGSMAAPMFDVPALMEAGLWDQARLTMQKLAYAMPREKPETRARFAELMKDFAQRDPLVSVVMPEVRRLVAAQPGIRQTATYPLLAPLTVEEARYILYFAEHLGHVQRRKKGNSYELYPMGFEIPEAKAPARVRKRPDKP